jgi:hypothetical protein
MRRDLIVVESGRPVGSVEYDDGSLKLRGAAVDVFAPLRGRLDDRTLGEDLAENGWSNGYLMLAADVQRADLNPAGDDDVFKRYWVHEEGRARWNTFTELVALLVTHVEPPKPLATIKRIAADWFHERFGFWPGDDRNRVRQGKPPRGDRIGPG